MGRHRAPGGQRLGSPTGVVTEVCLECSHRRTDGFTSWLGSGVQGEAVSRLRKSEPRRPSFQPLV